MPTTDARLLFVNLPVRDVKKSMEFFAALGFEFNRQFTNEQAACMVISDKAYVMLLSEPFFKSFTTRELCDTRTACEGIYALSSPSREGVDSLTERAIAAGARDTTITQDHGFM